MNRHISNGALDQLPIWKRHLKEVPAKILPTEGSELLGMEEQNCHLKYAMRIGLRYSSAVHTYHDIAHKQHAWNRTIIIESKQATLYAQVSKQRTQSSWTFF